MMDLNSSSPPIELDEDKMSEMRLPMGTEAGEVGSDHMPELRSEVQMEITREELERLYWVEKKSQGKIASKLKCRTTTIRHLMAKLGVLQRTQSEATKLGKPRPILTHEKLKRLYWIEKRNTYEIGRLCEVSHATIGNWMRGYGIPFRPINSRSIHSIQPDITPSNDLAYILGVLKGDGCVGVYKRRQSGKIHNVGRIILQQTRAEFAHSFEIALKRIGLNSNTYVKRGIHSHSIPYPKPLYRTYASSINFAQWYKQFSLDDIEGILGEHPAFIRAFVRGFYESEGSNYIRPRHKTSIKWEISMTNTDLDLLLLVKRLLTKLGFIFHLGYSENTRSGNWGFVPLHRLRSGIQQQNYRFIGEITPCIKNQFVENPAVPHKNWSREKVIRELKIAATDIPLLPQRRVCPSLTNAARVYFGSWNTAKEAAGLQIVPPKGGQNAA